MAGQFVDSLTIAIGLDTTQVAEGIQRVAQEIESGLTGAVDAVAPAIEGISEEFSAAAEEAAGLAEAASEVGEAASSAADAGTAAGRRGQQAARGVREEVGNTARDIRTELPRAAQQAAAGIDSAFARVKAGFKGFIAQILGPMAGAFAIGGAVSTFMNGAMAAEEAGQAFNVSAEELQLWQGAITRAGGSVSKFEMSLRKMTMSGKSAGDALKTLHDLAGQAEKMSREAFTAKAKELGIDAATIGVLAQGQKALDAHLKRAKEIGIYEKRHIEQAKRLKIGLWELGGAFDGLKNELLLMVLPAMEKILGILTDVTLFLSEHAPFVAAAIGIVGAALTYRLLPPLKALPGIIANVSKAFLRWMPFIAIVVGLAIVIEDLYAYLVGGNSQFAEFWALFGTGPEILAKLQAAWEGFKATIKTVWEGLKQLASYLGNLAKASGWLDGLKNAFMGLGQLIRGLFSGDLSDIGKGLGKIFRGLGQMVIGSLKSLGTIVKDLFKSLFKFDGGDISFASVTKAIWNAITTVFTNLGKFIASFWAGVFDIELPSLDELGKKIWDTIKQTFDNLKKMVTDFFKNMFKDFKLPSISDLFKGAGDAAGKAGDVLGKGLDLAKGAAGKGLDLLGGLLGAGAEGAAKVGEKLGPMLKEGLGLASEAAGKGLDFFKGLLGDAKSGAVQVSQNLGPALKEGWKFACAGAAEVGDLFKGLLGTASDGAQKCADALGPALQGGLDIAKKGLGAVGSFFSGIFGDAQPATDEAGGKIEEGMSKTAGAVRDAFNAAWQATAGYGVQAFQGAAVTIQQIFAGIVSGIETQVGALVAGAQAMAPGMVPAGAGVRAPARMQAAGGRGNVTVNQQNRINVDARGGDPAKVQRGVERGINPGRVTRAAASGTVPK